MPRPASSSATAVQALQTAAPMPERLTADALGQSGSNAALAKLNGAISELRAMTAAPMLQRAVDAIRAEDPKTACEWAIKALEQDEHSGFGWYLLAIRPRAARRFRGNPIRAYRIGA